MTVFAVVWRKSEVDGHPSWIGQTDEVSIEILPSVGTKVISLRDLTHNKEWMFNAVRPVHHHGYASAFDLADSMGWDDMFPTVDPSVYPTFPWENTEVPNHGELWAIPWQVEQSDRHLACTVHGIRFPYRLSKTYQFVGLRTIRIDYTAQNFSPFPFPFIWAAHPLFRVSAGARVSVPDDISETTILYSRHERLGAAGKHVAWPGHGENAPSVMPPDASGAADKYYFPTRFTTGAIALHDKDERSVAMRFPVDIVPYVGVWMTAGGYLGDHNISLQPCTGWSGVLHRAMELDCVSVLPPHGTLSWYLEVELS